MLLCALTVVTGAQAKPDRETDRLLGSVQTVKTEVVELTDKDGKNIERPRMPVQTIDYDVRGNRLKCVDFNRDGSVVQTVVYTYDAAGRNTGYEDSTPGLANPRRHIYVLDQNGNRTEYKMTQPTGSAADERYVYKYDGQGNRIGEELYHKTTLISRNQNSFDDQGRLISQTIYNPDGTVAARIVNSFAADGKPLERVRHDGDLLTYRVRYKYDDKGRLSELETVGSWIEMDSSADSYVTGKVVYVYKGKNTPKETLTYNPDGSLRERLVFDYDSHGNWTKRTRRVPNTTAKKEVAAQIEYRTITYH
jgi:YD repeat-containing protein